MLPDIKSLTRDELVVRRFFLISLVTAIVAVGLHVSGLHQFGKGLHIRAKAVTAGEEARAQTTLTSHAHVRIGEGLVLGGYGVAATSIVFFILSGCRHEPVKRSIVFAVLFLYGFIQFIQV
ncbi:MAG: hypothetical protein HY301_15150 [Verrucomicrobia bacterium]|nr:hypothetical protein [Verrucomicrobiota bacterium]